MNQTAFFFPKRKQFQNGISPTNVHTDESSECSG